MRGGLQRRHLSTCGAVWTSSVEDRRGNTCLCLSACGDIGLKQERWKGGKGGKGGKDAWVEAGKVGKVGEEGRMHVWEEGSDGAGGSCSCAKEHAQGTGMLMQEAPRTFSIGAQMNVGSALSCTSTPAACSCATVCRTNGTAFWHLTASTSTPYVAATWLCSIACSSGLQTRDAGVVQACAPCR
eukprot:365930-Chlamydomonas_euryale.AAC.23